MRRSSKSLRKSSPAKLKKKNDPNIKYLKKDISSLHLQNSLARKYSTTQNFHYITAVNYFVQNTSFVQEIQQTQAEECLEKYCKSLPRKHLFPKIKEVYKLHTQIPRIFQPQVKQILHKCHHRKRLLEYFKIAKVLGIKVESVKFSSFLISLNDITNKKMQQKKVFDPIITKISTIDFSTQAERNLLEEFLNHDRQSALSQKIHSISTSNSPILS